jgi:hypothetical protein
MTSGTSKIAIPLGQALMLGVLLSNSPQVYYNSFSKKRWPWLFKKHKKLWVDLLAFRSWCFETGRQLGERRLQKLDAVISAAALTVEMEAVNT